MQLDLSCNRLCGVDEYGEGTYTAKGITAIADALRVNGGLTELNIAHNSIMDDGITAICNAVQSYKESKLAKLNVAANNISQIGATAVAAMVAVTGALTELNIAANSIKDDGITAICNAVQGNKESKLAKLNVAYNKISPVGATAVAAMVAINGALTQVFAFARTTHPFSVL